MTNRWEFTDVSSRTKMPPRPCQNNDAGVIVCFEFPIQIAQRLPHRKRHRITLLNSIQRHRCDVITFLHRYTLHLSVSLLINAQDYNVLGLLFEAPIPRLH